MKYKQYQEQIKQDYTTGVSKKEMETKYGLSRTQIRLALMGHYPFGERRLIDVPRKHFFDYNYFNVIDTQDKAYWLGWLASDGSIKKNTIEFTITDESVVQNLLTCVSGTMKIKKSYKKNRIKACYSLYLNSKSMVEDLNKLGIVAKKAYRTIIPDISKDLIPHFIRGYFEGDGCIYTNKNRNTFSIVSCSSQMLKQLESIFKNENLIKKDRDYISWRKYKYNDNQYGVISVENKTECLHVLDYIYKNANLKLERKYKKYQEIKSPTKNQIKKYI